MDPRRNPFSPGAGVRPPELAGRDDVIEAAEVAFDRAAAGRFAKHLLLCGLHGAGKTALLNELQGVAASKAVETVSLPAGSPLLPALVPELCRVVDRLARLRRPEPTLRAAAAALRNVDASVKLDVGSERRQIADTGDPARDTKELLLAVAAAASQRQRVLGLFLDEVHLLGAYERAAVVTACDEAGQRGLPLMVVGAGLPHIGALASETVPHAERIFDNLDVGPLETAATVQALRAPAAREKVTFTFGALAEIHAQTRSYPYLLQLWAQTIWDRTETSPIDVHDVQNAQDDAVKRLDATVYGACLERLSARDRQYLRAMAELGPGPHKSGDIAAVLDCSSRQFGTLRQRLIDQGVLYSQRYGETAFAFPLFDEFMRRTVPTVEPYRTSRD